MDEKNFSFFHKETVLENGKIEITSWGSYIWDNWKKNFPGLLTEPFSLRVACLNHKGTLYTFLWPIKNNVDILIFPVKIRIFSVMVSLWEWIADICSGTNKELFEF